MLVAAPGKFVVAAADVDIFHKLVDEMRLVCDAVPVAAVVVCTSIFHHPFTSVGYGYDFADCWPLDKPHIDRRFLFRHRRILPSSCATLVHEPRA